MTLSDPSLEEALRRHVEELCLRIGPRPAAPGLNLARAQRYIAEAFAGFGLTVSEQGYAYHGEPVANVLAATSAAAAAKAFYLVGAHYDTVPGTPGADDNASAVAVMLELARRVGARQSPAPLRFAAFTLEEAPAYLTSSQGSRVYVQRLGADERVLGAVVLEMVGYTCPAQGYPLVLQWAGYPPEGNFIGVVGNRRSRRFGRRLLQGLRRNPDLPVESLFVPFNGWVLPATRLSDHASFWDHGWPAVMVTDTAFFRNPHYHLPSDRPETLDFRFMAELVEGLDLALQFLAPEA